MHGKSRLEISPDVAHLGRRYSVQFLIASKQRRNCVHRPARPRRHRPRHRPHKPFGLRLVANVHAPDGTQCNLQRRCFIDQLAADKNDLILSLFTTAEVSAHNRNAQSIRHFSKVDKIDLGNGAGICGRHADTTDWHVTLNGATWPARRQCSSTLFFSVQTNMQIQTNQKEKEDDENNQPSRMLNTRTEEQGGGDEYHQSDQCRGEEIL